MDQCEREPGVNFAKVMDTRLRAERQRNIGTTMVGTTPAAGSWYLWFERPVAGSAEEHQRYWSS